MSEAGSFVVVCAAAAAAGKLARFGFLSSSMDNFIPTVAGPEAVSGTFLTGGSGFLLEL